MKTDTLEKDETLSALAEMLVNDIKNIKICFICTGNTCRSPMAAALFNNAVQREGISPHIRGIEYGESAIISASSAGIAPFIGEAISDGALHALEEAGIESSAENDYKNHRATLIDENTMRDCTLIVGISARHAMALIAAFPQYAEKIISMPTDIPDPYGGDYALYSACLEKIRLGLRELFL